MTIPMSGADIGDAEVDAVVGVLRSGALSIGPQVELFEAAAAKVANTSHGIAVSSGTAGLHLGLIAAGVTPGTAVITSPFSFVASTNVILYEDAIPVFVDVQGTTGNIDPQLVAQAADALAAGGVVASEWLPPNAVTPVVLKTILPVHVYGEMADMTSISATAKRHAVTLMEDACEALGARNDGSPAGSCGDAAVFAFYPNKQMTTGEGGMIVTSRDDWAALFRSLRNQGRDVHDAWLRHSRLGYNYRLDEMSAALGLVQIRRIEELLANRARVAGWYHDRLSGIDEIVIPPRPSASERSWFVYVVQLGDDVDRDQVMRELQDRGVPSRSYFEPIHLQPYIRERFGYRPGMYPVAERLGRISLALPFSGTLREAQVEHVCGALRAALSSSDRRRQG